MRFVSSILALLLTLVFVASVFAQTGELYERALKYYATGKYSQAAETLKEYINERPDPGAYYLLGYSLYKLGRHDEARRYFKQVYLIDPRFDPSKIDFSVIKKR
ncbi:MAG: tetratricopeptide repeat protein [Nitrospirae bacterium]|nr:MAG: tetratricopeptide repeat protein [Nitrospirota bacterium]